MQLVGFVLVIIAVWCFYSGLNSFIPIPLAMAILSNPKDATALITEARSEVESSKANLSQSGGSGTGTGGPVPDVGSSSDSYQKYAFAQLSSKYGISDSGNQQALVKLWNQESNWNPKAVNPSSGAWGIAQILPSAHPDVTPNTNAQSQIDWGLDYIINRYGSPVNAWAHEVSSNWY